MAPAAKAMADALDATPPKHPVVPIVANVSAALETLPGRIRDLLVQQVTTTVRWAESVHAMADHGIDTFVELGAGKVLTGLVRRIVPEANATFAGTPAEIEALVKTL
jgi:[acyl-carrier-protein] S-malonyltransferase